jgi:uncharacterized protein
MTVQTWKKGVPHSASARAGAQRAISLLEELSRYLDTARLPVGDPRCRASEEDPEVLRLMIEAVGKLAQPDFTPMAAVAGAFSDLTKEAVLLAGADRALVNNGGDIALKMDPGCRSFRIGLVSDLGTGKIEGILRIEPSMGMEGVATSGLGGRSLTKGVASAVTCLAKTCAMADAAATSVANATNVDDPAVERCPAEFLDALTDLRGHTVTRKVGQLSISAARNALAAGLSRGQELYTAGLIAGCVIFVQDTKGFLPTDLPLMDYSSSGLLRPRDRCCL